MSTYITKDLWLETYKESTKKIQEISFATYKKFAKLFKEMSILGRLDTFNLFQNHSIHLKTYKESTKSFSN